MSTNLYTVQVIVHLESLGGNPRWATVADAVKAHIDKIGNQPAGGIRAGSGRVYVTHCEIDTADDAYNARQS